MDLFNSVFFSLSNLSVEIANVTAGSVGAGNVDSVLSANNLSTVDIEVQKLRVEQMRRLRKELRKLEKLERLRLNKAVGGSASVDAELMRQIQVSLKSDPLLITQSATLT